MHRGTGAWCLQLSSSVARPSLDGLVHKAEAVEWRPQLTAGIGFQEDDKDFPEEFGRATKAR